MTTSRRGKGDGSIYHRRDGRWVAVYEHGSGAGRRNRHYLYGKTRSEVRDKLRKAQAKQEEGSSISDARQRVEQFVLDWLDAVRAEVRERTWQRYCQYMRLHFLPAVGGMRLSDLSARDLDKLYAKCLVTLSPTTVRHLHMVIHRVLESAVKQGLLARNVANAAHRPRATRREFRTLSSEEVTRLIAASSTTRWEPLIVTAVLTGLRLGELLALRWRDIDFTLQQLSVRGTLRRAGNEGLVVDEPKTSKSRRSVSLSAPVVHALKELHETEEMAHPIDSGDFVFTTKERGPLDPNNVWRAFKGLLAEAELPNVRFHDLRHTAATLLLEGGVNPKVVSEMLGHSSVTVTLDVYSHVSQTLHREAADLLGEIVSTRGTPASQSSHDALQLRIGRQSLWPVAPTAVGRRRDQQ